MRRDAEPLLVGRAVAQQPRGMQQLPAGPVLSVFLGLLVPLPPSGMRPMLSPAAAIAASIRCGPVLMACTPSGGHSRAASAGVSQLVAVIWKITAAPPGRSTRPNSANTASRSCTWTSTSRHQIRSTPPSGSASRSRPPRPSGCGGDLGLGHRQGLQGAGGIVQVAAHRLHAVRGEAEPARQLDAVPGLAGPDIHRDRTRRQAQLGDQVKQQARAARREPCQAGSGAAPVREAWGWGGVGGRAVVAPLSRRTACPAGITTSFPSLVRTVKDPASACSRMPSTSVIGLLSAGPGRQRITTRLPTSARVSRTSSRYHIPVTC